MSALPISPDRLVLRALWQVANGGVAIDDGDVDLGFGDGQLRRHLSAHPHRVKSPESVAISQLSHRPLTEFHLRIDIPA